MNITYEMNSDEIKPILFEQIKSMFKGQRIKITIKSEDEDMNSILLGAEEEEFALKKEVVEEIENAKVGKFYSFQDVEKELGL